jgi:hypothetical protein
MLEFIDLEGRAVGDEHQLHATLVEMRRDVVEPDVFTNRKADSRVSEHDRLGQWTRFEDTLLVEDAVVGQLVLEPQLGVSLRDERHGVVQPAIRPPRQRDHESRRTGSRALAFEVPQRGGGRFDQRRPQHEVFRGIADEHQLGEHHEIGALCRSFVAHPPDERRVAGHIADRRVQLHEGDRQRHGYSVRSTRWQIKCSTAR